MTKKTYVVPAVDVHTLRLRTDILGSSPYELDFGGDQDEDWEAW